MHSHQMTKQARKDFSIESVKESQGVRRNLEKGELSIPSYLMNLQRKECKVENYLRYLNEE